MMRTPTEFQLDQLSHVVYDPVKAHKYYEEHKQLTGRKRASHAPSSSRSGSAVDPRTGKTREQISVNAKAKQKKELTEQINRLSKKLASLEALIKKKAHEESSENRKGKAKKERAAKEKDKPKSAAEKAKAARDNEKYRDKHKQELKNKAKSSSGGGSTSKSKTEKKSSSSSDLKVLATKVRGQISVAKQKLAAL